MPATLPIRGSAKGPAAASTSQANDHKRKLRAVVGGSPRSALQNSSASQAPAPIEAVEQRMLAAP
ncbi:hypothetical protein GCM10023184_28730 [Flaviaesturariibacter amylovorans]|uniref:Uncharacterized protein n=1 Tax=Flaviaesturariibacter amylovorans TaxID=1084520 RepID=A0ABP8H5Z0_9BACT